MRLSRDHAFAVAGRDRNGRPSGPALPGPWPLSGSKSHKGLPRRRLEQGSAVLVVIILTIIMCALIVANTRVLDHLDRELKQIDREQTRRLSAPGHAQSAPDKSSRRP